MRTQIDLVLTTGFAVLNAADEAVADLAQYSDGGVIFYAQSENEQRLAEHRLSGGRTAFWREGQLILAQGPNETEVLSIHRPAVARLIKGGQLSTNDMLIAACAAWALDTPADMIRAGVKSYGQNALSL